MVHKYQAVDLLHHCIIITSETEKKEISLIGCTPGAFDSVGLSQESLFLKRSPGTFLF